MLLAEKCNCSELVFLVMLQTVTACTVLFCWPLTNRAFIIITIIIIRLQCKHRLEFKFYELQTITRDLYKFQLASQFLQLCQRLSFFSYVTFTVFCSPFTFGTFIITIISIRLQCKHRLEFKFYEFKQYLVIFMNVRIKPCLHWRL